MRKKMSNKITIVDIAKKANVSISTVSRVLNNPSLVSKEKCNNIKKIIKNENFVVSNVARSFSSKHTNNIILYLGDERNKSQYSDFLQLLTEVLNTYNFNLILHNHSKNAFLNKQSNKTIISNNPCIIFSFSKKILNFIKIKNAHLNFVFLKKKWLDDFDKIIILIRKTLKEHNG